MKAYLDLSIIVHVFISFISLYYAMIIHDLKKHSYSYKTNHLLIGTLAYLLNLYYIPYFYLFYAFVRLFFIFIGKKKYIKTEIFFLLFYFINMGFLLLVGVTFIYEGILYINRPIATLFMFLLPLITILVYLLEKRVFKQLKKQKFICKGKLYVDEKAYKIKGYIDTGNTALKKEIPIIFINFDITTSLKKEEIFIQGIDGRKKYKGFKGTFFFLKKEVECYIIFIQDLQIKENCNCLLNAHLFN